jgi:hypothetical protein
MLKIEEVRKTLFDHFSSKNIEVLQTQKSEKYSNSKLSSIIELLDEGKYLLDELDGNLDEDKIRNGVFYFYIVLYFFIISLNLNKLHLFHLLQKI